MSFLFHTAVEEPPATDKRIFFMQEPVSGFLPLCHPLHVRIICMNGYIIRRVCDKPFRTRNRHGYGCSCMETRLGEKRDTAPHPDCFLPLYRSCAHGGHDRRHAKRPAAMTGSIDAPTRRKYGEKIPDRQTAASAIRNACRLRCLGIGKNDGKQVGCRQTLFFGTRTHGRCT